MVMQAREAQSVAEYAIFIVAVLAGLIAIQVFFQRAFKGNLKERADSLSGEGFTTTQDYAVETRSQSLRSSQSGFIEEKGAGNTSSYYTSESKVLTTAGTANMGATGDWIKALDGMRAIDTYVGHEYSEKDYVVPATIARGTVGTHATFDSGQVGQITPWEDAGITASSGQTGAQGTATQP